MDQVHTSAGLPCQQKALPLGLPDIQTRSMHAVDGDDQPFRNDMHEHHRFRAYADTSEEAGFSGRDRYSSQHSRPLGLPNTHPPVSADESELQRVLGRLGNAVLRGALTGLSLRGGLDLVRKRMTRPCSSLCTALSCEPPLAVARAEAALCAGFASPLDLHAREEEAHT